MPEILILKYCTKIPQPLHVLVGVSYDEVPVVTY